MSDGLLVPGAHDGMAAFEGENGRIVLACNHELSAQSKYAGPYTESYSGLSEAMKSRFYGRGKERSPGLGGTTTTIYNSATRKTERQFLSLAGVCFSPDGNTMFVNIQYPGMTVAITGPWPA
jgi:uncharacterized protein